MTPPSRLVVHVLAAVCPTLLVVGCRDSTVNYYEVAHEATPPAPAMAAALPSNSPPDLSASSGRAAGPQLEWDKPAGWTEKPRSEMRLASYAATGPDGAQIDVSVTAFPDAAGGLLANINRWRGQVALPPVDEAQLAATAERTKIAGQVAWRVDFAGTPPAGTRVMGASAPISGPTRILGAIVPLSGTSWFFKMLGPDAAVLAQRAAFQELIASIRAVTPALEAASPAPDDPHAGIPGAPALLNSGRMPAMSEANVPPPPRPGGFAFDVPEGWQPQPQTSSMRLASFLVPGPGVPAADVSLIVLAGPAGGDLANVNRWRGQLGLAAISEAEMHAMATHVSGRDLSFDVFDLESSGPALEGGHRARILAGVLKRGDSTWFLKMTGEAGHVASQHDKFVEFLRSFRFESAP